MKKLFLIIYAFSCIVFSANAQHARKGEINGVAPQGSYLPSYRSDGKHTKVNNVILLIGDGMGLSHVSSAMYANGGELTITNLKATGYVRTQSASDFTTDSAASGTAYATGTKTRNGALGVDMDGNAVENIAEILSKKGYSTGVLTTDFLDGATPAAFFAHQGKRGSSHAIWSELAESSLNFVSGGCRDAVEALPDSISSAIYNSYDVIYGLDAVPVTDRLLYLPSREESGTIANPERKDWLPATAGFAIDWLHAKKGKGFFLMVEGARIDKSSHSNDYPNTVLETLDFDKAVEAAVRFADKDGHTLVIVTADHETGSLTLRGGDPSKGEVTGVFSSGGHSPVMVPLFAYGPWSDMFCGVYENSDVFLKIRSLLVK